VRGGPSESGSWGALVDGRRSASWMLLLLTRGRRNRRWLFGTLDPSRIQAGWSATESVRGRSSAWLAVDNAVAKQHCLRGALRVSSRGSQWSTRPKLEARRQSCVHLRLGHRKNVARRRSFIPASVGITLGQHSSRCALGNPNGPRGARFGSRLQRSERSIFPVAREVSREAS
jgi:hypothetical protein